LIVQFGAGGVSSPATIYMVREMRQRSKCNSGSHTDGQPAAVEAGFCNEKTFSQASVRTPKFGTAVLRLLLDPSARGL
jgi:hypothetical protein